MLKITNSSGEQVGLSLLDLSPIERQTLDPTGMQYMFSSAGGTAKIGLSYLISGGDWIGHVPTDTPLTILEDGIHYNNIRFPQARSGHPPAKTYRSLIYVGVALMMAVVIGLLWYFKVARNAKIE